MDKVKYLNFNNVENNNHNNIKENNNTTTPSSTSSLNRLVTKLSDIISPKKMRQQHNNIPVGLVGGFPLEPMKHKSASIYSLSEQIDFLNSTSSIDDEEDVISCVSLAKCIESTLREAKSQGFDCGGEVLVPIDLTSRVAEAVLRMAEDEPCGIRGCIIYINYEDTKTVCKRIGKVRCDPNSVATFEVVLTLRPDTTSWLRLLPLKGCWKKFRNIDSIVVSSGYSLVKNKLYRSSNQQQQ